MTLSRHLALAFLCALVAAGCRKDIPVTSNLRAENKVAPRTVTLFYENADLVLEGEPRSIDLPGNPAAAIPVVLGELLKGSANPAVPRILPPDTVLRGAYLLPDGTVFVDLGGPTLTRGWAAGSHEELMAVHAIVQTVTANFPEARQVRLLVNGSTAGTLAGHVDLERSFRAR